MAVDNTLVNDMRKMKPLCQDLDKGLGQVCNKINSEMKKFREEMHSVCADPWMASMRVEDYGVGFSRMLNDSLAELDKNINKNLNVIVNGLYGAMYIVARGHGFNEGDIPKNNEKYVVAVSQLEPMYNQLANGNVGIPQKGNAADMAAKKIKALSDELGKCKDKVKSLIQGNLSKAFEEETIQDAAKLLSDKSIGEIEKGVNQVMLLVKKFVTAHVEDLEKAKNAAASNLNQIGSGAN